MENKIKQIVDRSNNRIDFCINFVNDLDLVSIAEVGVFKGEFAEKLLRSSAGVENYLMVDPWRNLSDWNKPANENNDVFEGFFQEALRRTSFASERIKILRGKTTEVIDQIEDDSIDLVYIDGDHTLKGVAIDLINLWPKVKKNGFIIGDDFSRSIWQHNFNFEPTMVFPFAVYFAEAVNAIIYGLPFNQFLITKESRGFIFNDLTNGLYSNLELRGQLISKGGTSKIGRMIKKFVPYPSRVLSLLKK